MQKSLNDITPTDLEEITRLAGLFFTAAEIAIMLEYEVATFCDATRNETHAVFKAFQGGNYQGQIDLRSGIMKMAKAGSTPAQTMGMDLFKEWKIKNTLG